MLNLFRWCFPYTRYDPLSLSLERVVREHGVPLSVCGGGALRSATLAQREELLDRAVAVLGTDFADQVGRQVALLDNHPVVLALRSATSLPDLLARWVRFEERSVPGNRFEGRFVEPTVLRVERRRADGSQPPLVEDALCLATAAGFVEAFGMTQVRYGFETVAGQRVWTLQWGPERQTLERPEEGPWGIGEDDAKEAFSAILPTPNTSLDKTARALGVSARTLQRRLDVVGTSFNELVRVARLTRAARGLLHEPTSITEVALVSGFSDSAHLSREFRSLIGVQPLAFRRAFR